VRPVLVFNISAFAPLREAICGSPLREARGYFKSITYRLVTPRIFFFCMVDTTPALKRSEDMGAWMIWVRVQPVFLNIS